WIETGICSGNLQNSGVFIPFHGKMQAIADHCVPSGVKLNIGFDQCHFQPAIDQNIILLTFTGDLTPIAKVEAVRD
ncbi:MAG TPA: hypothetical protein PLZ16_11545, partial [Gammaproteobacteria bacterium]|nr:hypothetical protein [Gammaproteobacteria bacterium]